MSAKRKSVLNNKKSSKIGSFGKNHTLDSDEEDSDSNDLVDFESLDFDGEEDGVSNIQGEIKITPFNMKEELEEGQFDKDGHYHWKKTENIQDNWLDNIDWIKVKSVDVKDTTPSQEVDTEFDKKKEKDAYVAILKYMKSGETIEKALRRIGKSRKKLSTAERIRQKKLGVKDAAEDEIIRFTELINDLLTKSGNMDIYQESYELIKSKINNSAVKNSECDMYSDDFNEREKQFLDGAIETQSNVKTNSKDTLWEFKWKEQDENINGPFSTNQMLKWFHENYFKDGAYVRRFNETNKFYSINRIDFDLYL